MLDLVYLDIFFLGLCSFPFNRISAHFAFTNEPVSPSHNTAHFTAFQQHQYYSQHSTYISSMQGMPPPQHRQIYKETMAWMPSDRTDLQHIQHGLARLDFRWVPGRVGRETSCLCGYLLSVWICIRSFVHCHKTPQKSTKKYKKGLCPRKRSNPTKKNFLFLAPCYVND